MELQFEQHIEGFGSLLECPACGDNYLTHKKVEIFERKEDAVEGVHVSIESGKVVTDMDLSGNPSSRRHGLSIHFRCENCSANPILTIAQHKGNTWVDIKTT